MPKDFELDLSKFVKAMKEVPDAVNEGAARALGDIKDDWVEEAQKIAPVDTGNLRDLITGEVRGKGTNGFVEIAGNAHAMKGGDHFNYAYYIHELNAGGKSLNKPGAKKKFLDESAEKQQKKWQKQMEKSIGDEVRKVGFKS